MAIQVVIKSFLKTARKESGKIESFCLVIMSQIYRLLAARRKSAIFQKMLICSCRARAGARSMKNDLVALFAAKTLGFIEFETIMQEEERVP